MVNLATACPGKPGEDSGTATGPGESTSGPTSTGPGESTSGPTSTGTETTEPPTSTGTTTATGGEDQPAECGEVDAEVDAAAVLTGWPLLAEPNHQFDYVCVVDTVTVEAGQVLTALTCTVEDVPTPASLQIADVLGGGWVVDWAAGDEVLLRTFAYDNEGLTLRNIELHDGASNTILMASRHGGYELPESLQFPPLTMTWDRPCEAPAADAPTSLRAMFTVPDGDTLSLISGHRGTLAVGDGRSYAIDLEQFIDDPQELHHDADVALLLRRVRPG